MRERSAALFTVLGQAGIGKSRLVAEARLELGTRRSCSRPRCLPYGEGITFWPLREMLVPGGRRAARPDLAELLTSQPDQDWVTAAAARFFGLRRSKRRR